MLKKVVLLFGCMLGAQISTKAAAYNGPGDKETSAFVPLALKCALAAYSPETAAEELKDSVSTYTRSGSVPVIETFGENNGLVYFNGDVENPEIIVAFRGTQELSDWKFNLSVSPTLSSKPPALTDFLIGSLASSLTIVTPELSTFAKTHLTDTLWGRGYAAHGGFSQYYATLADEITAIVQKFLTDHALPTHFVTFIFTGHSLGGAAAHIAAIEFKRQLSGHETWSTALNSPGQTEGAHVRLITACSPRVFCPLSATRMETYLGNENVIRLWRMGDPVSALPSPGLGYRHMGVEYVIPAELSLNPLKQHDLKNLIKWITTNGLSAADPHVPLEVQSAITTASMILPFPVTIPLVSSLWFSFKKWKE